MSNRVREEGASEGKGENSKGKANNNPEACVGLGLGLKARPEGWGWGRGMMLNSFPDYSMWDLFCLRLSGWAGSRDCKYGERNALGLVTHKD